MNGGLAILALGFGNPAMLVGLGAASIPIIIHLLHKRRYKETSWAAMRFLAEAARKQSRRLRWEQLLVLLIRCLAVMFLATAFARPFFDNAFSSVSGREPRHVIVVLDDSFSMGQQIGNETRLEQGKEAVRQMISGSITGDGYSLICMTREMQAELLTPTFRQDSLLSELEDLQPTQRSVDLNNTFARLESLLQESPQPRNKEILLVSDFQQRDWEPSGSQRELLESRIARLEGEQLRFTFLDVGGGDTSNLAVSKIKIEPQPILVGQSATITATIQGYGGATLDGAAIELLIDDRSIATRSVSNANGTSANLAFVHTWQSAGQRKISVRITEDRLEADNQRFQVIDVREAVRVLLVEGKPAGSTREKSSHYLRAALETVMHPVSNQPLFEITTTDALGLNDFPLQEFEVIGLCNLPGLNENQTALMRRHLSTGGGLLIVHGDQTDIRSWTTTLNRLSDRSWPVTLQEQDASQDEVWGFLTTELTHPVVKPFDGNPGTGLESAVIWQRIPLKLDDTRDAEAILDFDDGSPALVAISLPNGRCLETAMACDATSGSWAPLNGSFPPIAIEIFRYLVSEDSGDSESLVGESLEGLLPIDQFVPEVSVIDPVGERARIEPIAASAQSPLRSWNYDATSRSGFYQIDFGLPSLAPEIVAVNVDPREGDLTPSSKEEIRKELFQNPQWNVRTTPTINSGQVAGFRESPLSQWLLWLGLALLAVEVALVWNFSVGLIALLSVTVLAGVLILSKWIGPAPAIAGGVLISCLLMLLILQRVLSRWKRKKSRSFF
ncbi:MAG: BatA domain-containing protein [Planctomycetaceae bacterium]|nr:BatA domain-containing protein [Planctomycetaceae bacterium]